MAEALSDHILGPGRRADPTALAYLGHLTEQSVENIRLNEQQQLAQASHTLLLSVQALSKRCHKQIVESASCHSSLRQHIPVLARRTTELGQAVPKLDQEVDAFSTTFAKASENDMIARRKKALRLLQNAERLVDVMELPPLLTSAVSTNPISHSSTLDLYAHVRRLASLYPSSPLVESVMAEADSAIHQMASDLIVALKAPNLKLAAGLRTIGWLKRLVPELVSRVPAVEALPALFLVCRFTTLIKTLEALDPLRNLADEEGLKNADTTHAWSRGQHTERYLKRFIEVYREHSFGIVSVSKNVDASLSQSTNGPSDPLSPLPSILVSFPLHLVGLLMETLQAYLPNIKDHVTRESILTQVLYCAGSLGRLGADFGMYLSSTGTAEWIELVKRHRLLAGRLESVIGDYKGTQTAAA